MKEITEHRQDVCDMQINTKSLPTVDINVLKKP